jgi:hypothetical protein
MNAFSIVLIAAKNLDHKDCCSLNFHHNSKENATLRSIDDLKFIPFSAHGKHNNSHLLQCHLAPKAKFPQRKFIHILSEA